MPFINGKYVPADEASKLQQAQPPKKVKDKKHKGKQPERELTPEEIAAREAERDRKAAESAAAFEKLIASDKPDLTELNKLVEKEKKHVRFGSFFYGKAQLILAASLIACIFLLFMGMSFASAEIGIFALAAALIISIVYFLIVPRH